MAASTVSTATVCLPSLRIIYTGANFTTLSRMFGGSLRILKCPAHLRRVIARWKMIWSIMIASETMQAVANNSILTVTVMNPLWNHMVLKVIYEVAIWCIYIYTNVLQGHVGFRFCVLLGICIKILLQLIICLGLAPFLSGAYIKHMASMLQYSSLLMELV